MTKRRFHQQPTDPDPFDRTSLFEEQLPKREDFGNKLSLWISVGGLALGFIQLSQPYWPNNFRQEFEISGELAGAIYAASLSIMFFGLAVYVIRQQIQKKHKYAEVMAHIHFVAHLCRDFFYQSKTENITKREFDANLDKILNTIAHAFSIAIGRHCEVHLKRIDDLSTSDGIPISVSTYATSAMGEKGTTKFGRYIKPQQVPIDHYSTVSFIIDNDARYYLCNDAPRAYEHHKFIHPYLIKCEKNNETIIGGFRNKVVNWKLPFKSALAVPVRAPKTVTVGPGDNDFDYHGILCIHCSGKNVFSERYSPELANAFADSLCIFFDCATG